MLVIHDSVSGAAANTSSRPSANQSANPSVKSTASGFRLIYKDPNPEKQYDLSGNEIKPKSNFADNLFRHIVFAGEFILSKSFHLRVGYNHQRRQELRAENKAGLAGFSFGGGIQLFQFNLDYAYSNYHAVGGTNSFTLSTSIERFAKKKEKPPVDSN